MARPAAPDEAVATGAGRERRRSRVLSLIRLCWGVSLLSLTRETATNRRDGLTHDDHVRLFTQILGVRHIGEAFVLLVVPSRRAVRVGSAVDAIHSVTMLGLAGVDRPRRRLALAHAVVAACWAMAADSVSLLEAVGDHHAAAYGGVR